MPAPQFFLREGSGFDRKFETKQDLFTTFGTCGAVIFTSNNQKSLAMKVSAAASAGIEEHVSNLCPGAKYVFEAAYRMSSGIWRANVYDKIGGATIWTATSLTSTDWANVYHQMTLPANCSAVRIRWHKVTGVRSYLSRVQYQGNVLLRDPDNYGIDWSDMGYLHRAANGERTKDRGAVHAGFTMNFPNITASAMRRMVQMAQQKEGAWLDDGNALVMTAWGTAYASVTYNFSGVSQGGGGATLFKAATSAARPVGSTAMESTELANSQYAAIGTDNNTAATVPVTINGKYGYIKMNFVATQYTAKGSVHSIDIRIKADGNDLAEGDVDGVELYAWDGAQWLGLARSQSSDKRTLRYRTRKKEIARKLVDLDANKIRLILKARGEKESGASCYMHLYHVNVAVNKDPSRVYFKTKAVPNSGALVEVKNMTTKSAINSASYSLTDDRTAVDVGGNTTIIYPDLNGSGQRFYATDANFPEAEITGDLTIEGWYLPATILGNKVVAAKYGLSGYRGYQFYIDDGEMALALSSNGTLVKNSKSSGAGLTVGTWAHIAAVYDASAGTVDFYKNGLLVSQVTGQYNSIYASTADFTVGASSLGSWNDGGLDEIAIFDDKRSAAELLASYNTRGLDLSGAGNIIGFWDFNDDGSATAIDNKQGDSGRDLTPYSGGGDVTYANCGRTTAILSTALTAGDIVRVKYNQHYNVAVEQLAEPTIYGGDVTDPRGVGAVRLVTLNPIG